MLILTLNLTKIFAIGYVAIGRNNIFNIPIEALTDENQYVVQKSSKGKTHSSVHKLQVKFPIYSNRDTTCAKSKNIFLE